MQSCSFYVPEPTSAISYTSAILRHSGHTILQEPAGSATHMLLPIPTKNFEKYQDIAKERKLTVIGGNLPIQVGLKTWDLLKDPEYLAKNAEITADCTETLLRQKLPLSLKNCRILIIGWGRIGMCLTRKLGRYCPDITVCTGTPEKADMCKAFGYSVIDRESLPILLPIFRVIVNTAPAAMSVDTSVCREDAVLIDLASIQSLAGDGVNWARGLPGKMEPEENGKLIAETIIHYLD